MKVCIVSKDLTAEPKIGFALHVHNLAKELGKKYDVDVVSFGGMITHEKIVRIGENVEIMEIPDPFSLLLGGLSYKLFRKPTLDYFLSVSAGRNRTFKKVVTKKINGAKVVVFEGCWHAEILNQIPEDKIVIYNAHNVEYLLKSQVYTDRFTKKYLLPRIFLLEKQLLERADYIFALSPADKEEFVKRYRIKPEKIIVNYTFAVDVPDERYTRKNAHSKSTVFLGSTYFANIEAANFINSELASSMPDYNFHILGECGKHIKKPQKNVHIHGFVSKYEKDRIIEKCGIAIAPIFHGSGICGKIIEYLAYDLPVVCTPLAFRGLGIPRELVVLSSRLDFARNIRELSKDKELMEKLSIEGKKYFLQNRSTSALITQWEEVLQKHK